MPSSTEAPDQEALGRLAGVRCGALILGVVLASSAVHGQEPAPVRLEQAILARGEAIDLLRAWRFHPGDDPRWSDPAFDDSRWELVEPQLEPGKLPAGGWPGVGWFRRHLRLEPALAGKVLAVRLEAPGAARVFLDGHAILASEPALGTTAADFGHGAFGAARFDSRPVHLLAVRYELSGAGPAGSLPPGRGFRLSLGTTANGVQGIAEERRRSWVEATLIVLPSALALLHLALFWAYPKSRENLFYAASMVAFAGIVAHDLVVLRTTTDAWRELALRAGTPFILAAIFFVLLTFFAVRTARLPRSWIGFAAAGCGLAVWSWFDPSPLARSGGWYVYFGAMVVESFRVGRNADALPREGASILFIGLALLGATVVLQILLNLGIVPALPGITGWYIVGMLAFAVAMSLYLARSFARTRVHLERRLAEVRTLSAQVLDQERAAHEQELRRRLLEAENTRKGSEIAAARELQLSMLPASLPQTAGLETAAVMTTATEVGGDFYDFKLREDGSLVVAVGDATGHGLPSGTLVTAIKALFSVLGDGQTLPQALAECSRALRRMNLRHLHMCLTMARITPRTVTVCCAAMPPVLLYRARTGQVEELGAAGLPLGSGLDAAWEERSAALAPGDTLLLASDGFVELLDPAGTVLGYDGAASALRAAGGAPADETLRRLVARAAAWRGDREPSDDVTLVCVRVRTR
ncbi:MAG TPA: SpoIIE family protein phosphatase [Thermoanaerobaculia bacterium]|jgi:serine phosphatase RsbU (regulator of sigma subunit)|nr:SpoIIE family protein phosphatase [Thermoanaerobaculia bacterium]